MPLVHVMFNAPLALEIGNTKNISGFVLRAMTDDMPFDPSLLRYRKHERFSWGVSEHGSRVFERWLNQKPERRAWLQRRLAELKASLIERDRFLSTLAG